MSRTASNGFHSNPYPGLYVFCAKFYKHLCVFLKRIIKLLIINNKNNHPPTQGYLSISSYIAQMSDIQTCQCIYMLNLAHHFGLGLPCDFHDNK